MSKPSVRVENLSKCYRVYPDAKHRMRELLSFRRRKYHQEKWALKNVNFELWPGQALGIVGVNGAGKSTLLKLLTGTTRQTTGDFEIEGTLSSLLELGAGFHPDFSGKQNIYMNASVQGVSKEEVDAQYEEIVAFTELGSAIERPVRTYSSGMAMRLGFAASMLVSPDVLILDEVLAVGDAYFQKKCMKKFAEFRARDKTILFVSHSVYHVREICDRVIWLHDGEMVMDGTPVEVTDEYETRLLEIEGRHQLDGEPDEPGNGLSKIARCEVSKGEGKGSVHEFTTGDRFQCAMDLTLEEPETVRVMVAVSRNDGLLVISGRDEEARTLDRGAHRIVFDIPELRLLAGEYMVSVYLTDDSGAHIMDQMLNIERFAVSYSGFEKGVALSDYSFRLEEGKRS